MRINPKINLFLDVKNRRSDGFHNLLMVNARIKVRGLYDTLTLKENRTDVITIRGMENQRDNILYKTLKVLKETFNDSKSYKIKLIKRIPVGAGLGGGSMDSAGLIKLYYTKNKLKPSEDKLKALAEKLGSDVYYGLFEEPVVLEGTGSTFVKRLRFNSKKIHLITFPFSYLTKDMFEKIKEEDFNSCGDYIDQTSHEFRYRNVFLKYALADERVNKVYGELTKTVNPKYITLSGSGPTLLVVEKKIKARTIIKTYNVKILKGKIMNNSGIM